MTGGRGRWLGDRLDAQAFLNPKNVAKAVFHPAWIPPGVDPTVESLKRARIICGTVTAVGVYSFVQGGFAFDEMLENVLTASLVLLVITPLTVGVMLLVWRRRAGHLRRMRTPLTNSLVLLLIFIGSVAVTVTNWQMLKGFGFLVGVLSFFGGLWLTVFVGAGAVYVSGNFFGTAVVHRCLPPLLAMVTTWLVAIPDLVTGDLHGLSLTLGIVFILGAPVTVTAIALLEMRRLRRHHGIRLGDHPATLPVPGSVPPPPSYPPSGNPYAAAGQQPPSGNPYAPGPRTPPSAPTGNPYAAGRQAASYPPAGNPYTSGH
ncbi:glucose-6-phosphate isomerase [Streptomyces laurentii]|uniref:Glucose-6-phosphate isomerase n=1 Tax=Streptomyces laurentii TaxID=39478 RepID=A0A160NXM4_STRLU|nr:glucose-6-phosphate isomerase [Streptomyces laurentii]